MGGRTRLSAAGVRARLGGLDWSGIEASLWERGYARTPPVLTPRECADLVRVYADDRRFRSRIDMARYRFGAGDYKYFAEPLPPVVAALREHAYPPLAGTANRWMAALGARERYPGDLAALRRLCARHGQTKPTPLLLHYETGGYNCLHRDLYGDVAFPLQLTVFLSRRGEDYTGGEFLLVEQRPRAQSRGEALTPEQGEMLVFTTRDRPVKGARGYFRAAMRHGVSTVASGTRYTLGVIFHDAK
ncbi:MAG: 2OG-Fe(II) oxygenase [Candidatus Rokuibacteriota bacterium]